MDLSNRVLGSYVAKQLQTRGAAVLLRIGRDTFVRRDLARVECYNFTAAANLSAILNEELTVKDTADVFHNIAPRDLALPRLGAISLAVLGAAFEAKKLGGDHPLETWVRNHTEHHKTEEIVTFGSMKHASTLKRPPSTRGKARKARRFSPH